MPRSSDVEVPVPKVSVSPLMVFLLLANLLALMLAIVSSDKASDSDLKKRVI